jgi:Family of unknown function (DUF6444)
VPDAPGVPYDADALRAENGRLRMLLEDKDAKIAELEERVARLERLLSRNSGNSSMPPGTDDLPGRKPPLSWRNLTMPLAPVSGLAGPLQ